MPDIIRSNFKKKKIEYKVQKCNSSLAACFDPLYEYLLFAQLVYKSKNYSGCYNFGPINKNHVKVSEIVRIIKKRYNDLKVKYVKNSLRKREI